MSDGARFLSVLGACSSSSGKNSNSPSVVLPAGLVAGGESAGPSPTKSTSFSPSCLNAT
eukprot:CAMPEP_0115278860 /NCGR_PEP_ID=MMETSP0270-20121206/57968_1 /TAXON_ID=71861 /ORGANISM="Scrippsiella trochoidea, Strain CCMP3099" /LENGTH=58 /DNA_ID=CAMNT_0002695535 /DNA_START=174 /DNA_END=350 /DNA_ORIENTATION=+